MPPLHERLADARDRFVRAGIPREEATLDAELLARHVLGCDRATFLTRARDPLPSAFDRLYEAVVQRRVNREPMAYILGHREFWGLEFEVTRDVLIPRPETELIVEEALSAMPARDAVQRIVDVGTGSGCLAIVLAIEFSSAQVTAIDVSEKALLVAQKNCHRHHVTDRVSLVIGHLLDKVEEPVDLIVSNPPYVPAADAPHLQPEVARYEPATALYAGVDGLTVIRQLLADAAPHLGDRGRLIIEFGIGQEAAILEDTRRKGWTVDGIRRDLQSIPRVAVLRR